MIKRQKPSKIKPKGAVRTSSRKKPLPHILISPENWYSFYADLKQNEFQLKKDATVSLDRTYRLSEIQPWIESGFDLEKLSQLLKERPALLAHPVVWASIGFLIQAMEEEAAYGGMRPEEQEWGGLLDINKAWVEGLSTGYKLQFSKSRGRPPITYQQRRQYRMLLDLYTGLLTDLQKYKLCQKKGELREAWENRLIKKDIPKIWKYFKSHYLPNKPDLIKHYNDLLPNERLESWATEIMDRCGETGGEKSQRTATVRDYLAFCLVGWSYDLAAQEAKNRIALIKDYMRKKTKLSPPSASKAKSHK